MNSQFSVLLGREPQPGQAWGHLRKFESLGNGAQHDDGRSASDDLLAQKAEEWNVSV